MDIEHCDQFEEIDFWNSIPVTIFSFTEMLKNECGIGSGSIILDLLIGSYKT